MFFLAFFILAVACSVITIKTLVGYTDISLIGKIAVSVVIITGWFMPMLAETLRHTAGINPKLVAVLSVVGYSLLGFLFILFCFLMLRDIIWYAVYGVSRLMKIDNWALNPKNVSMLNYANLITLGLSFLTAAWAFYQGIKLPELNRLTISSALIKNDFRLVQISDLHIDRTTPLSRLRDIVAVVNVQNADAIVLTGDIFDDDISVLAPHIAELRNLSARHGVFAVLGNHEYYNGLYTWIYQYQQLGFNLLFNNGAAVRDDIFIAGVPDMQTASAEPQWNINLVHTLKGSRHDQFKILLSHYPSIVNSITSYNFQLLLSGHTHGGQIFPFHWFVKKANGYLSGDYKVNGVDLHLSNGAGTWGPSMRLFAPSEIAVIDLLKK